MGERTRGRVVIVTNRTQALCDATRQNLAAATIETDLVLCQLPGESDKSPRFQRLRGTRQCEMIRAR